MEIGLYLEDETYRAGGKTVGNIFKGKSAVVGDEGY
jgi:hypothetical protein